MSDVKTLASGVITLDAEAIKAFANLFDPQPYHLDQQAADKSIFGGLCASGWQVAALSSRLAGEALQAAGMTYITTTRVDSMRWLRPSFVGDELMARVSLGEESLGGPVPDANTQALTVTVEDGAGHAVAEMQCQVAVAVEGS